ncbi:MAG: two-component system, LytTR family, sensor kinase [Gammaproteobacteria bacterium]|nr:two-component system, LytTR family, sensor kinase [Gammaproteobacteria bacterium]
MIGSGTTANPPRLFAGGLSLRQFLSITCLFWVYVAVSNILYAYSMRTGIARVTNVSLFAPWDARLLQHVLLLPILLVSFWASLRIQWRPLLVALPLQLILGTVFCTMAYPAMLFSEMTVGGDDGITHVSHPWLDPFTLSLWLASFVNFLPTYGFGLALVTGLALYTRFRNSELRLAALEREWSTARLAALRMQLSPHTLFNLLHTIRGHIEWDPKGAQSMVVQLADLLRRLLNAGELDYSKLNDELQIVRLYLELQQRRFADRLTVILPAGTELPAVWVPSLILQPLVENAVVHGLAGHQGPVTVRITVCLAGDALTLYVINTIAPGKAVSEDGIGLYNVRERLAVQFEGRAGLTAGGADGVWRSEITLPAIHHSPLRETRPAAALVDA